MEKVCAPIVISEKYISPDRLKIYHRFQYKKLPQARNFPLRKIERERVKSRLVIVHTSCKYKTYNYIDRCALRLTTKLWNDFQKSRGSVGTENG